MATSDLHFTRAGQREGVPVVLIHGFAGDAMTWSRVAGSLGAAHPLILLELPCHGQAPHQPIASFDALVGILAPTIAQFGPCHLVGHSLGGSCATALAARPDSQALSLALIAPGGLGPQVSADILAGLVAAETAAELGPWLRALVRDPALFDAPLVEIAMQMRSDPKLRSAQAAMADALFPEGRTAFDLLPLLDGIEIPTAMIWGKSDRVAPWRDALNVPGSVALHLFAQMGHIPHLEAPDDVAGILLRHLRGSIPC